MQKIVVGILAVFFVQIGFQVFTAVEQTNDEYAAIETFDVPASSYPSGADVDDVYAESMVAEPAAVKVTRESAPRRETEPLRAAYRRTGKETRFVQATTKSLFPPVIITPASARAARLENTALQASVREQKPGKSLPAKALTVIKKPYDWLKAVGSKLL